MARKRPTPVAVDLSRAQATPLLDALVTDTRLTNAREVAIDQVIPDPGQPRRHMDEDALRELQDSVAREGILQPLLVREDGMTDDGRTRYIVIAGSRRLRAAQAAGLTRLPVVVRAVADARELRVLQLVENLQREDLDPIEEAVALRELMELRDLSTREVGDLIHRSHMHVQRRLDLLFDERIMNAVRAGQLNASVAVEIKSMPEAIRENFVARAAAGEALDVAALREAKRQARAVIWGDRRAAAGEPSVTNRYTLGEHDHAPARGQEAATPRAGAAAPSVIVQRGEERTSDDSGQSGGGATGNVAVVQQEETLQLAEEAGRRAGEAAALQEHDTSIAQDWARGLVEALLETKQPRTRWATIESAIHAWREAGAPNWWGVALLHTLAQQLDLT